MIRQVLSPSNDQLQRAREYIQKITQIVSDAPGNLHARFVKVADQTLPQRQLPRVAAAIP